MNTTLIAEGLRLRTTTGYTAQWLPGIGLAWTAGPTVTAKTEPDGRPRRIEIAGGSVESRDGWIVVRGTLTGGRPVVVGPGTALTATRSGQFVVALVPVPGARERQPSVQPLVYRIR